MIPYYEKREVESIKSKIKDLTDYMNEPYESVHEFGSKALQGDYYKCNSCKHEWKTRNHAGKSAKCPSCSSVNIVNTSILSRKEAKKNHLKEISDLKKEVKAFEKKFAKEIEAEKKEQLRKEREIKKKIAEQKRRDEKQKKFIETKRKELLKSPFEKKIRPFRRANLFIHIPIYLAILIYADKTFPIEYIFNTSLEQGRTFIEQNIAMLYSIFFLFYPFWIFKDHIPTKTLLIRITLITAVFFYGAYLGVIL